jgi:hypothetical protein
MEFDVYEVFIFPHCKVIVHIGYLIHVVLYMYIIIHMYIFGLARALILNTSAIHIRDLTTSNVL